MATQNTQSDGFGMALLKLLAKGVDKTQQGVDRLIEGPISDVGAKLYTPEAQDAAGRLVKAAARQFASLTPPSPYDIYGIGIDPIQNPNPRPKEGPNPNLVMNDLKRQVPMEDFQMPRGNASFGENLPEIQPAQVSETASMVQSSQVQRDDPLVQAILSILAQKPQPTEATPVRDTAAVVDEFNRRNPRANPENKPGFDKFLDFIGLSRGPAELNPAELLKLQADLGISSEGLAGEQQLNRGMRSTEHAAVVGGQPQARDYLNILAGKSNIQDQANVQSRLQAEQAGLTKDINRANVGNQKEIIGATSAAQTSPRAVRSEIAVRNPEGMTKETFEETIGVPIGSLSNEQWEIIRASNNKAASPMEQVMAMLIAERIGRTGPGRQGQGQVPINTSALTQ